MDREWIYGMAVVLFLVRDCRLLTARPGFRPVLVPVDAAIAAACGAAAENLSRQAAQEWIQEPERWIGAVCIHAFAGWRASRLGRLGKPINLLAFFPGPIWMLAMVSGCHFVLTYVSGLTGLQVGLMLGGAYGLAAVAVSLSGWGVRKPPAAYRFSAATHGTAVLLILAATALHRPLTPQAVDWPVTVAVLGAVAAVVAASFAWHRRARRRPSGRPEAPDGKPKEAEANESEAVRTPDDQDVGAP